MKKWILIVGLLIGMSQVIGASTTNTVAVVDTRIIEIIDFTVSDTFPISNTSMGKIDGITFTFDSPVTNTVQLSYERGGRTYFVYTETGSGTTFSWAKDTGDWLLLPKDVVKWTSTVTTTGTVNVIVERR